MYTHHIFIHDIYTHHTRHTHIKDTPGLLDRPEEDRNEMERLTYASLAHLPTGQNYDLL